MVGKSIDSIHESKAVMAHGRAWLVDPVFSRNFDRFFWTHNRSVLTEDLFVANHDLNFTTEVLSRPASSVLKPAESPPWVDAVEKGFA
jgi:hypothetical protein